MAAVATTSGVLLRRPETQGNPLNQKRNLKTNNRGDDDYHPLPPTRTQTNINHHTTNTENPK
jgi:hypothetical protein